MNFSRVFLILLLFKPLVAISQPIPVGSYYETQLRKHQLLGDSSISSSFMNRPLWIDPHENSDGANYNSVKSDNKTYIQGLNLKKFDFGLYDIEQHISYNEELPFGGNDGSAWAGKGINTRTLAGFYLTSRYATLTIRPEFSSSQNLDFAKPRFVADNLMQGLPTWSQEGYLFFENYLAESIDAPYRFGPDAFTTFDWGHTSFRLHHKELELGATSENLWWGPGLSYSLAMSNNAPGVPHLFLGSRSPLKLPGAKTGNMEFRWMIGFPETSKYHDFSWRVPVRPQFRTPTEPYQRQRLLNGLHIVYSPGFLPNLHISYTRFLQQYIEDGGIRFKDVTRVFLPFPKPDWDAVYSDFRKDQSFYEEYNTSSMMALRLVFPESNAEFFMEFYKESVHKDLRDFIMEPQHDRAYNVGAQKLTPIQSWLPIRYTRAYIEFTNLVPTRLDDTRPQTYIYTHQAVKQGHTHKGQLLGPAIGIGSDSQLFGFDLMGNNGFIGAHLQRIAVNDQFHYELNQRFIAGNGYKDYRNQWVQLNWGFRLEYDAGLMVLSANFTLMKHYNYGRYLDGKYREQVGLSDRDLNNFQSQFVVRYRFLK